MKKTNVLLLLPLLFSFVSCNEAEVTDPKQNIINTILNGVNVKISGQETTTYPDNYSYMNKINTIDIDRDYKIIKNEDGSTTPAVRENTDYEFLTYISGENGQATREVLTSDNKVTTKDLLINAKTVLFKEHFANPFEYIDEYDISDDFSLNLTKANLLVEKYTGLQFGVESAKFIIENNVATGLNIKFYDKVSGLETSQGILNIVNQLKLDIDFSYDITDITRLTPRKNQDETLKKAFNDYDNYTLTFSSDATTNTCIAYITDKLIYIHNSINEIGALNNDVIYKKVGENSYDKYVYRESKSEFSLANFGYKRGDILPDRNNISPEILVKQSENIYTFDNISAVYGLEKMIIPNYAVNSGNGVQGTLTLENGNFATLQAKFDDLNPFTITQTYYDHGTTSIPAWLDVSSLK